MLQRMASIYRFLSVLALAIAAALSLPLPARAQLSQNSGINSADTWVTFDLTMKIQATVGSLSLPTSTSTYHIELGYDPNGLVLANAWPTGSAAPGSLVGAISVIRLSGGNLTLFDQNGVPIPDVSPGNNLTAYNPQSFLGTNPGASVVERLVVPNIQQQATKMQAQYSTVNSTYVLTTNYASGPLTKEQWTYISSGSQYLATQGFVRFRRRSGKRRTSAGREPSSSRTSTGMTTPRMTRRGQTRALPPSPRPRLRLPTPPRCRQAPTRAALPPRRTWEARRMSFFNMVSSAAVAVGSA